MIFHVNPDHFRWFNAWKLILFEFSIVEQSVECDFYGLFAILLFLIVIT